MFDTTWSNLTLWRQQPDALSLVRPIVTSFDVEAAAALHWEEHCLECAAPACYRECSLFRKRGDLKCLRTDYGLVPDERFQGLFPFGIDCRFRKWSKIEATFGPRAVAPAKLRNLDRLNRIVTRATSTLSTLLLPLSPTRKPLGALTWARNKLLTLSSRRPQTPFNCFLLECYSLEEKPFRMALQCDDAKSTIHHRETFELQPGHNLFRVPVEHLPFGTASDSMRVFLHPLGDVPARVVFTWLDFVRLAADSPSVSTAAKPAKNVKCVAWDLDNTLWSGILIEDGLDRLTLNADAVAIIRELDRRGIVHTVVSKNTHEQAWEALQRFGIAEYFVYPAINWGPKSENLRQVIARLNIGLDAVAFVDDSPFERAEVASQLPMVRVYPETRIRELLQLPEFDVPVTEMSRKRRAAYLAEMKREEFRASAKGDNLTFLRACAMRVEIFSPRSGEEKARCLELLQRSNQLNLSSRRYDPAGFEALLGREDYDHLAFRCCDRFGDHGVVGFISMQKTALGPEIMDMVISCRVANKRVEHALIDWLARRERGRASTLLTARLVKSGRNAVLAEVFRELPFQIVREDAQQIQYSLDLTRDRPVEDIVTVSQRLDDQPCG